MTKVGAQAGLDTPVIFQVSSANPKAVQWRLATTFNVALSCSVIRNVFSLVNLSPCCVTTQYATVNADTRLQCSLCHSEGAERTYHKFVDVPGASLELYLIGLTEEVSQLEPLTAAIAASLLADRLAALRTYIDATPVFIAGGDRRAFQTGLRKIAIAPLTA